jgi:hypothetical protein
MTEAAAILEIPPAAPKKPKRRRSYGEHFRTDDEEHAELMALARDAGLSLGAYYRRQLLGVPGLRSKRAAPTEESRLRLQHVIAINRAGALVNQGIRALNETALKAPQANSRDRLADEIIAARELLRTAIPALLDALAAVRGA